MNEKTKKKTFSLFNWRILDVVLMNILTFEIFKYHDVIKCSSIKHKTHSIK